MWTEELQQQTRDLFEKMNGALMKHFGDGRFGLCVLMDGKYIIRDLEKFSDVREYNSVDEMIEDGWAID